VPLSPESNALRDHPAVRRAGLGGGDDYELAFTAPAARRAQIEALSARLGLALTPIGRIEAGAGVRVIDRTGGTLDVAEAGFDHFG